MDPVLAVYREFAPHAALQPYIRAVFSFIPGAEDTRLSRTRTSEFLAFGGNATCPPILADGHACLSFTLGEVCHADGRWRAAPTPYAGHIVGATHADSSGVERPSMIGAYFRAGGLPAFTSVPVDELTDRVVRVEDVLGPAAANVAARLAEASEAVRIDALESLLIERLREQRRPTASVDVAGLAASIEQSAGQVTVEQLAHEAGISRQHLTRLFRERVGVTPKLYARLARFQSGLAYAGAGEAADWVHAALALGYADQSHWIAEFKEFSGLTPHRFAARRWFHPFVERAVRVQVRPPVARGYPSQGRSRPSAQRTTTAFIASSRKRSPTGCPPRKSRRSASDRR
jgi:AraC-like DNA-binding protein